MIDRREFIVALGATGLLAACQSGPPKPSAVTVNLTGAAGMNPGPGGGDRPVTVLVMRLRSTGKFNSADYFALQGDAGSALAGDLIGSDQISVGPGKTASKT
ncbi:MAG: type VI secretion system lipoprotein TssJ, partial [Mesorhizobium sp.]